MPDKRWCRAFTAAVARLGFCRIALRGLALVALFHAPFASAGETLGEALRNGKILFDGRLRFERVAQANFAEDAHALTFRARFGYETAPFKGFKLLLEGDFTRALGIDDYNSTVNGKTAFPVIADPVSARLNRASLAYVGIAKIVIAAGRQRIILDDARFVGNVGFRQNEQTFDSVLFKSNRIENLTLTYAYVWRVNRIFGSRSPAGALTGGAHLLNASWSGLPIGAVTAYAYLVEIDGSPLLSSQTFGARLTGDQKAGAGVTLLYTAGYARQSDYRANPGDYALGFIELEGGLAYRGAVVKAGWQQLAGNGAQAFQTPLATLHAFQGFADQFLATPSSGIEDFYLVGGYKKESVPLLGTVSAFAWYHNFSPARAGPDLGQEVDFLVSAAPKIGGRKYVLSLLVARFYGAAAMPDVTKIWLTAEVAF